MQPRAAPTDGRNSEDAGATLSGQAKGEHSLERVGPALAAHVKATTPGQPSDEALVDWPVPA